MISPNKLRLIAVPLALVLSMMAASAASAADDDSQLVQPAGHCCEPACACEPDCCCEPDCGCESGCCGSGCCGACCDGCRDCCVASAERVKVEKHCWCVECEKICVPKVVCPWAEGGSGLTLFNWFKKNRGCGCCVDSCCAGVCCRCSDCCGGGGCCSGGCCCCKPRCGKVKCVRDLVKKTYECDACEYKWKIRRLPPCCCEGCCSGGCCGEACCDPCCADPCCGASAKPVTKPAAESLAQPSLSEIQMVSATEVAKTEQSKAEAIQSAEKKLLLDRLKFWK